jgi:Clr5 domain
MAPSSINLDPYKDEITHLLFSGKSILNIIAYFKDSYAIQISRRTLQRRLQAWEVVVRPQTQDTPALRTRITELFFYGLNKA